MLAHTAGKLVPVVWERASVLYLVGLTTGPLAQPPSTVASPRASDPRDRDRAVMPIPT